MNAAAAPPRLTDAFTRAFDLVFASAALLALSPAFCVLVPVLRLTGEGDVFFRQKRIGRGGRPFQLIKFATMLRDAPSTGAGEITLPDDPRVLPVGRVLRKAKLNELPQLINVIAGDLSLIGPRPQTPSWFAAFRPDQQACIASVRPGLSGAASVIFRDEEAMLDSQPDPVAFDREVIVPYKGEIECWFVANRSLGLYFRLIVLTALAVLFPRRNFHRQLTAVVPSPPELLAPLL